MFDVSTDSFNPDVGGGTGLPDEVPGLDDFLSAQPPITEDDVDAMFIEEMTRRDHEMLVAAMEFSTIAA